MTSVVVYNRYLNTRGGGEKLCLALAAALASSPEFDVVLLTNEEVDKAALEAYFNIDLSRVPIVRARYGRLAGRVLRSHRVPGLLRNTVHEWTVRRAARHIVCDLFVNHTHWSYLANSGTTGVYLCMFPNPLGALPAASRLRATYYRVMNLVMRMVLHRGYRYPIDSYQQIVSISQFTRSYVASMWGRESPVLYPPCEDMHLPSVAREKIILHVGRFFPDIGETHHKRQDFLLEQFLAMPELAQQGWSLVFVGSLSDDPISRDYVASMRARAGDAPVTFHTDLPFPELRELYNRASIYWHATGYDTDHAAHPEKQEHFGIVTVEAMSAGCIPVVIDSAGQREVVENGVSGHLWSTPKQLQALTRALARSSEDSLSGMRAAAVARAALFGRAEFDSKTLELFHGMGS